MRRAGDLLLAIAICLLDVFFFSTAGSNLAELGAGDFAPVWLVGYAALGAAALIWRRRSPVAVYAIVWVHAVVGAALVHGYQPVLGMLVALYTVGAHRDRRLSWLIAPTVVPFSIIAVNEALYSETEAKALTFIGLVAFYTLFISGVWALGYWTALSRRRLAESQRMREVEAQLAVAQERARLSRELHDIVAHSVTVMVLQSAGAQRILRTDPQRAIDALTQVEATGRQAMSELRRMLALQGPDGEAQAHPGLDDLGDLVDGVRRTGVPVEMVVEGEPKPVDPSVGLAAYRAVQEALTNAAKHAGVGAATTVRLMWTDDLVVRVTNAIPLQAPSTSRALSTGHGLLGLRERVAVVGGRLEAGHRDEGGYQVTVSLPVVAR
ncbi:two-component sensor histidine kinase [Rhizocola hellebori]|uniref:histidine kinase n=2 Tax=Rhizocola hellebori TaxID=1392758 RepID=A0A8J3VCW8_9ACTN|nr:two-component sensor histidine kinase [Rhizocola hellebori]